MLAGCGGNEESTDEENANIEQPTATTTAAKKSSRKKTTSSVMDRIDAALDQGDYMKAADIAIKEGRTREEKEEYLNYVGDALGDPMARGDTKAHRAYKKLNAFYDMQRFR